MASFNPMSLPPGAAAGADGLGLGVNVVSLNAGPPHALSMDAFDQDLGFDESLL